VSPTAEIVIGLVSPGVVLSTAAIAWGRLTGKLREKETQEESKQQIRDERERERHVAQLDAIKEVRAEVRDAHLKIDALAAPIAALEARLTQTERRVDWLETDVAA
jgi:hypothetical protein